METITKKPIKITTDQAKRFRQQFDGAAGAELRTLLVAHMWQYWDDGMWPSGLVARWAWDNTARFTAIPNLEAFLREHLAAPQIAALVIFKDEILAAIPEELRPQLIKDAIIAGVDHYEDKWIEQARKYGLSDPEIAETLLSRLEQCRSGPQLFRSYDFDALLYDVTEDNPSGAVFLLSDEQRIRALSITSKRSPFLFLSHTSKLKSRLEKGILEWMIARAAGQVDATNCPVEAIPLLTVDDAKALCQRTPTDKVISAWGAGVIFATAARLPATEVEGFLDAMKPVLRKVQSIGDVVRQAARLGEAIPNSFRAFLLTEAASVGVDAQIVNIALEFGHVMFLEPAAREAYLTAIDPVTQGFDIVDVHRAVVHAGGRVEPEELGKFLDDWRRKTGWTMGMLVPSGSSQYGDDEAEEYPEFPRERGASVVFVPRRGTEEFHCGDVVMFREREAAFLTRRRNHGQSETVNRVKMHRVLASTRAL